MEPLTMKNDTYPENFASQLAYFRSKSLFVDATIICEEKPILIHQVVLAICSTYFKNIFENTQCSHPIVIIEDIDQKNFELLLDYMYTGRTQVSKERFWSFIKDADFLQVKGLEPSDSNSSSVHDSNDLCVANIPCDTHSEGVKNWQGNSEGNGINPFSSGLKIVPICAVDLAKLEEMIDPYFEEGSIFNLENSLHSSDHFSKPALFETKNSMLDKSDWQIEKFNSSICKNELATTSSDCSNQGAIQSSGRFQLNELKIKKPNVIVERLSDKELPPLTCGSLKRKLDSEPGGNLKNRKFKQSSNDPQQRDTACFDHEKIPSSAIEPEPSISTDTTDGMQLKNEIEIVEVDDMQLKYEIEIVEEDLNVYCSNLETNELDDLHSKAKKYEILQATLKGILQNLDGNKVDLFDISPIPESHNDVLNQTILSGPSYLRSKSDPSPSVCKGVKGTVDHENSENFLYESSVLKTTSSLEPVPQAFSQGSTASASVSQEPQFPSESSTQKEKLSKKLNSPSEVSKFQRSGRPKNDSLPIAELKIKSANKLVRLDHSHSAISKEPVKISSKDDEISKGVVADAPTASKVSVAVSEHNPNGSKNVNETDVPPFKKKRLYKNSSENEYNSESASAEGVLVLNAAAVIPCITSSPTTSISSPQVYISVTNQGGRCEASEPSPSNSFDPRTEISNLTTEKHEVQFIPASFSPRLTTFLEGNDTNLFKGKEKKMVDQLIREITLHLDDNGLIQSCNAHQNRADYGKLNRQLTSKFGFFDLTVSKKRGIDSFQSLVSLISSRRRQMRHYLKSDKGKNRNKTKKSLDPNEALAKPETT